MILSDQERQAPTKLEDAEPTHLARYNFALKYVSTGDRVIDVPCGSGYGTKLIAQKGVSVYGVDIHSGTIEHAKEFFSGSGISFLEGNMENLENIFPEDNYFDVIISFEGIEHIKNPNLFLNESKRLLKNDGKMIISTPRKPHGSPYHITEYSLEEFKKLLSKNFVIEDIFGQIYTDIFNMTERKEDPSAYGKFNFIAICTK